MLAALNLGASAQNSLAQILQPPAASSAKPSTDPFGRDTPSGAVFGFLQAAQAGNYHTASEYLQMSASRRQSDGEDLARKLKIVMDRAFVGNLKHVSTLPEGDPQDGVPRDHQKLGTMASGDAEAELELAHVVEPGAGKIWLIAADTLEKIPEVYEQIQARQMETRLPGPLVRHQLAGMPLWQWLALLLALPFAAAAGWMLLVTLEFPRRWWARRQGVVEVGRWQSVSGPAWLMAATIAHRVWARYLGLPLLPRHDYGQISAVVLIVGANWLAWRVIRWFLHRMRMRALSRGRVGTGSVVLLGERLVKAVVFLVAVFTVLSALGFNLTTALAGLGIGGLAIGFGAQKTIENLFGGLSVLGDEVIRVGDSCRFGDRIGVVEDIGLRSTRVRTDERTLLAIPNGTVATINVENLSRRDKVLFKTDIGLHWETTPKQVRQVLTEIRQLLSGDARVETATTRVRFTELRPSSLNLELFCYIQTRDIPEFMAIREELLLLILDIVERAGSSLAVPTQTLYLARDAANELAKRGSGASEAGKG